MLGISAAAFRMRLSGARRALDRAVVAGAPPSGDPTPEVPAPPAKNSKLKEVIP